MPCWCPNQRSRKREYLDESELSDDDEDEERDDDDDWSVPSVDEVEEIPDEIELPVDSAPPAVAPPLVPIPPPFIPPVPFPVPVVVPVTTADDEDEDLISGTPAQSISSDWMPGAIVVLDPAIEYTRPTPYYVSSGQFTQSRNFPLMMVGRTEGSLFEICTALNKRNDYTYSRLSDESFVFPYWVPPDADLSKLPYPEIKWEVTTATGGSISSLSGDITLRTTLGGVNQDRTISYSNSGGVTGTGLESVLISDQMASFSKNQFNNFVFKIRFSNTAHIIKNSIQGASFCIRGIKTSLPPNTSFNYVRNLDFESRFGIKVRDNSSWTTELTPTGSTNVSSNHAADTTGLGFTYSKQFGRRTWGTAGNWFIFPTSVFPKNKQYDIPIYELPDNNYEHSMENGGRNPGPPWNLLSEHETFYYAQHWLRQSDYAQQITDAHWFMPKDILGVIVLEAGSPNSSTSL